VARPDGHSYVIDDFVAVRLHDLRCAAGGRRRFREEANYCSVRLPDGRLVKVDLVEAPTNLPGQHVMKLPVCPSCGAICRVLRIAPVVEPGVACASCLKKTLSARFRSQIIFSAIEN
jgi:hypothetical protein